jgi:diacylglycerol kinase family enzyme
MYYYIVDTSKLTQRQFDRVQQQLYSSISDYHISGEIVRTTGIRTIKQLVETAFFHQAKTIVAVGTDETLNSVINLVGDRPAIIGYIPLVPTELSESFGISSIAQACKALGLRRVEEIDLGVVNGMNFLSKLTFGLSLGAKKGFDFLGMGFVSELIKQSTFRIGFNADNYHAETEILGGVIINCQNHKCEEPLGKPTDGLLDVVLIPKLTRAQLFTHRKNILDGCFEKVPGASIMHLESLEMTSPTNLPLMIGRDQITMIPARIEIKPKALKMIVGRERKF